MHDGTEQARPHVVMVVSNDIANDARVKKEALAVARLGLRVTLLGMTSGPRRTRSRMGDVDVLRIPVRGSARAAAQARRSRRRQLAVIGWRSPEARAASEAKVRFRQREIKAQSGEAAFDRSRGAGTSWAHFLGVVRRRVVLTGLRGRRRLTRARSWLDERHRASWRRWDEAWGERTFVARWRRLLPEQVDRELSFGPEIDRLDPDLIHAHDADMVGVAALAVGRARLRGRDVRWVYDAHEYVAGLSPSLARTPRTIAGWADYESRYIRGADRIITVSAQMADALVRRYDLDIPPAVVLNTPVIDRPDPARPTLREVVGLDPAAPLLVYAGGMTPARGVETAIEAMRELPGAHLALVCVPHPRTPYVRRLRAEAAAMDLDHRVHFLDPVPPGQVVTFLSSADIGIFSGLRYESHDVTLANKLFEYLYAGLPLVVSDLRAQAQLVTRHRLGQVFPVGDAAGMARAARTVIEQLDAYKATVRDPDLRETYSWGRQEEVIRGVYQELLGRPVEWVDGGTADPLVRSLEENLP